MAGFEESIGNGFAHRIVPKNRHFREFQLTMAGFEESNVLIISVENCSVSGVFGNKGFLADFARKLTFLIISVGNCSVCGIFGFLCEFCHKIKDFDNFS